MFKADFHTTWPTPQSVAPSLVDNSDNQPQVTGDASPRTSNASFMLPRGTWFDETIDLRQPEGHVITTEALARIEAVETRTRKRSGIAQHNHSVVTRRIIANALRCHFHRRPARVAYWRKADGYQNKARWLSGKAMSRTADLLEEAGLLVTSLGEPGTSSTYEATEALISLADDLDVTINSVTKRLSPERLIKLRSGSHGSEDVNYPPTPETKSWTRLIEAYNAFLAQQDIALDLSAEEERRWLWQLNCQEDRSGLPLSKPELFRTDLCRIFNNGTFKQGGRLYGGWWTNTPKALRNKIKIARQPTIELDYSGCAIRMLYHERGIEYLDDPYWLKPIAELEGKRGLPQSYYREAIKALVQAAINDTEDGHPEKIRLPNHRSFYNFFSRLDVMKMIEEKHILISDSFRTGAGLRLQREDSDIALGIITALREQNIVALPIHDSFIVTENNENSLRKAMEGEYEARFNYKPVIK